MLFGRTDLLLLLAVMVACSGTGLATHNLLCMPLVSWVPRSMGVVDCIWIHLGSQ